MLDLVPYTIPVLLLCVFIEYLVGRLRGHSPYRLNDSVTDVACGLLNLVVAVFTAFAILLPYAAVYEVFHLVDLRVGSPWAWLLCLVGADLAYYWYHRLSHEHNFLWVAHVVHHQSHEYNLSVGLRQGAFEPLVTWPFYLCLALVGFPPLMFATAHGVLMLYQFFIHTREIDRLGPLELVMNTPSHHRVHHGCDPKYRDRNFGAVFILWDRLFGTWQAEEEEPTYGLVDPTTSWNPVWVNVEHIARMRRHARGLDGLGARLKAWWGPPSALTAGISAVAGRSKYDAGGESGAGLKLYVFAQFLVVTGATLFLLFEQDHLPALAKPALAAFVVVSTVSLGWLLEGDRRARTLEVARMLAVPALVWTVLM